MNILYDVIQRFYLASLHTEPTIYDGVEVTNPVLLSLMKETWLKLFCNAPALRIYVQLHSDKPYKYYLEAWRPEHMDWNLLSQIKPEEHKTLDRLLKYCFKIYPDEQVFFIRGGL